MKNTALYYIAILAPVFIIIYFQQSGSMSPFWFCMFFFFYFFIYRTVTDFFRLVAKGVLTNKDFFKILFPGSRIKYFQELYFFNA